MPESQEVVVRPSTHDWVAEESGNVRVTFSGRYRVTEYKGEQGTRLQHEVRADEVAVSLRGQSVRVVGKPASDQGDDTPF